MDTGYDSFTMRAAPGPGKVFLVADSAGVTRFRITRKAFSTGNKTVITDPEGTELAVIRRRFSLIVPKYRVCIPGEEPFTVARKMAFSVEYAIPELGWSVLGSGTGYRCFFGNDAGNVLFALRDPEGSWRDRFSIRVYQHRYALHGICIAASIDAAVDDIRKTSKK